jgi:hypothetical protein
MKIDDDSQDWSLDFPWTLAAACLSLATDQIMIHPAHTQSVQRIPIPLGLFL